MGRFRRETRACRFVMVLWILEHGLRVGEEREVRKSGGRGGAAEGGRGGGWGGGARVVPGPPTLRFFFLFSVLFLN